MSFLQTELNIDFYARSFWLQTSVICNVGIKIEFGKLCVCNQLSASKSSYVPRYTINNDLASLPRFAKGYQRLWSCHFCLRVCQQGHTDTARVAEREEVLKKLSPSSSAVHIIVT